MQRWVWRESGALGGVHWRPNVLEAGEPLAVLAGSRRSTWASPGRAVQRHLGRFVRMLEVTHFHEDSESG